MATIKIILRTEKIRKNGESPLYIRMTVERKSKYISLKQTIEKKYWDGDKQRVKKSHPNAALLNSFLAKKKAEIEALALELEQGKKKVGKQGMRSALSKGGAENFFDFTDKFLERLEKEGRHGTKRNYSASLSTFRKWIKKEKNWKEFTFEKFTPELANAYKSYLEMELGNSSVTIQTKFAVLKSMLSHAREAGVVEQSFRPLAGIKVKVKKAKKNIPSREEIGQLTAMKLKKGSHQDNTRNLYLFCANMAGLRFGDAITLRWGQVEQDRLRWQTLKTNKQRLIYIPQIARDIIDRYRTKTDQTGDFIFPFLNRHENTSKKVLTKLVNKANSRCNYSLKAICRKAGLTQEYTFHTSRHFFATDSLRRGMRVEVLQHILTHSSLDQTMEYARIANEDMDAAMKAYEQAKMN